MSVTVDHIPSKPMQMINFQIEVPKMSFTEYVNQVSLTGRFLGKYRKNCVDSSMVLEGSL